MNKNVLAVAACAWLLLLVITPVVSVVSAQTEEVQQQEDAELKKFFEDAHGALDDALRLFDDAQKRPEEGDLAFYDFLSRTKESQERKVEGYLDVAAQLIKMGQSIDMVAQATQLDRQTIAALAEKLKPKMAS